MSRTPANPRYANGARRRAIRKRALNVYDTYHICDKPVDKTLPARHPWSAEVDEIISVSQGGSPYEFANCRLAHRACNQMARQQKPRMGTKGRQRRNKRYTRHIGAVPHIGLVRTRIRHLGQVSHPPTRAHPRGIAPISPRFFQISLFRRRLDRHPSASCLQVQEDCRSRFHR
ncbi:HNH endonuclease [Bifidobacterium bifidum]|uniref:HNH endonuclease n=1 Tax=Bifidobacterium bifidum TaxID=1681 RepID=UPI003D025BF5